VRIEGASGTPKKGFKIEKVKIHGVGPLRVPVPFQNIITVDQWFSTFSGRDPQNNHI